MSLEENKEIALQFVNGIVGLCKGGDFAAFAEKFVDCDFVSHDPISGDGNLESLEKEIDSLRDGLSGFEVTINDMVAEGDKVVVRQTIQGTHQGEFMGVKPTGKQVRVTEIVIMRLKGGKIVESWVNLDHLGMMQQLGVIPPLGQDEK